MFVDPYLFTLACVLAVVLAFVWERRQRNTPDAAPVIRCHGEGHPPLEFNDPHTAAAHIRTHEGDHS
jgi:hypothetical protein